VPSLKQHAPSKLGQAAAAQFVPGPCQTPLKAWQAAASATLWQVPSTRQQAPGGCSHGFGVQVPNIVHISEHSACNVTAQLPSGRQQEPVGCSQGFSSHVPNIVQIPLQAACRVSTQVPSG
jgi:hypothetical protein